MTPKATSSKVYTAELPPCEGHIVWVTDGPAQYRLRHVVHHSPGGFEWGYEGSGPADLALSLCADILGPEPETRPIFRGERVGATAWDVHLQIRWRIVSHLPRGQGWTLTGQRLLDVIRAVQFDLWRGQRG